MHAPDDAYELFVALSSILTGFARVDLYGTGLVPTYVETVLGACGSATMERLDQVTLSILARSDGDLDVQEEFVRKEVLADARLGPVARNLIQLWYLGTWFQLPTGWSAAFGTHAGDTTRIVSAQAYEQSLVYDVMHAHPPGAKQPGFGSWHVPPQGVR